MKTINPSTILFSPLALTTLLLSLMATTPAHAHHAMDGKTASNAFEGFLSGLAHPVIGIDHLAMVVAIGVLAAALRPGLLLAIMFIIASMVGTGLHLLGVSLPASEELISLSVIAMGILLVLRKTPSNKLVFTACAIAGALHGYAYGESIFGAEPTPLTAYLAGFTIVQLIVAAGAYAIAKKLTQAAGHRPFALQPAGYVVAGVGLALFATQIVALAFPLH